jgi:hypothetical protein
MPDPPDHPPGVRRLNVNADTFEADLDQALQDGYARFSEHSNFLVLTRGYGAKQGPVAPSWFKRLVRGGSVEGGEKR